MKKVFKLMKLFVLVLLLGCSFSFVACNDDENVPQLPDEVTTETMFGNYDGKMLPTIHYLYLVEPCFINYSYISAICRCFYLIGILTKFHGFRNYWYYLVLYFRIYFVPLYQ